MKPKGLPQLGVLRFTLRSRPFVFPLHIPLSLAPSTELTVTLALSRFSERISRNNYSRITLRKHTILVKMDWLHCNNCFVRGGKSFAVSSCGHIFCENCASPSQCRVCHSSCNYLPISDQMKPQEKMFFEDPIKLIQSRLEHLAQIAIFQKRQKDRVIAFYRNKSLELERKLKEVSEQCYRQVSELKRENQELKKPLSQRRTSPGRFQTNGGTPRMTLPVAVTSPVTSRSRNVSFADTLERFTHSRLSTATPPGSSVSLSSLSSLHNFRTPSSVNTPTRSQNTTPNNFQFQLLARPGFQPRQPWNVQ